MKAPGFVLLVTLIGLGGCAGLQQFPVVSQNTEMELATRDPEFLKLQIRLEEAQSNEARRQIRDDAIDRQIRLIDIYFRDFVMALQKENVQAQFGIAVTQVGVGLAGALVTETASQILSAVSGGLAGAQAAYGEAALFDQAMPALLAQMVASRKSVLAEIVAGKQRGIEDYPILTAQQHIEAYYFAGSLPGAIVATSADATVKLNAAEKQIAGAIRVSDFGVDDSAEALDRFLRPPDGRPDTPPNFDNVEKLEAWIEASRIKGTSIANFLSDSRLASLRQAAVEALIGSGG